MAYLSCEVGIILYSVGRLWCKSNRLRQSDFTLRYIGNALIGWVYTWLFMLILMFCGQFTMQKFPLPPLTVNLAHFMHPPQ